MQTYGEVGENIDTFFDSFSEFIDMCNDAPIPEGTIGEELFDNPIKRREDASSRNKKIKKKKYDLGDYELDFDYGTWSGADSWEETLEFAYQRWTKGSEFMQRYRDVIETELRGITFRKEFRYDVTGSGLLDVQRHLMGMPDPFLVDHENDIPVNEKGSSVVRILFNGTTVAHSTPEQMMMKGAMVTALAELFEANNRRCEIMIGYCLGGFKERAGGQKIDNYFRQPNVFHTFMIPLKTPGQALQPEQVYFATGCPAMQRRLVFSLQERFIQPIRKVFSYDEHYGMVTDFQQNLSEWDIIVPATVPMNDVQKWKQWVLQQLEKQGIKVVE